MKKIFAIVLAALFLSSCVKDEIYVPAYIADADVQYEYFSDAFGTVVEGDLYNDGETHIESVELELRFYDSRGVIVDYEYVWVDTYFNPGGQVSFYYEFPQPYISDVRVFINNYF